MLSNLVSMITKSLSGTANTTSVVKVAPKSNIIRPNSSVG